MTATTKKMVVFLITAGLVAGAASCIMEDRIVELVVTERTCVTFAVNEQSGSFGIPTFVFLADEVNSVLEDNDVSRDDIVTARIVSMWYTVTEFSQTHDWEVTGSVTVERYDAGDGPDTLLSYVDQSVEEAVGKKIPAKLNAAGVGLITRALDDFIDGGSPVLIFRVSNAGVSPVPSPTDRIVFLWKPCLEMHIVAKADVDVPDPF